MPILYIISGVPGSGKSYFCDNFTYNSGIRHVSRDLIRYALLQDTDDYFAHEEEVYRTFVTVVVDALQHDESVIADATHLNAGSRKKLIQSIDEYFVDYQIIFIYLSTDFDICCSRNRQRTGRRKVPEATMIDMYSKWQPPRMNEDSRCIGVMKVKGDDI